MNTTFIIISITTIINFIVGVYLLYNHHEQKEINIDNEMDIEDALSKLSVIEKKIDRDINELNYLVREIESEIKSDNKKKLEKLTEQIIKKIPITNDTLLKEVKQMRDDFFALRQNF